MRMRPSSQSVSSLRSNSGSMVDFACSMVVLIVFMIVPLLDLAAIPIRYSLISQAVHTKVKQLARLDTGSQVFKQVRAGDTFDSLSKMIGDVTASSTSVAIAITQIHGDQRTLIVEPRRIPKQWQPDGMKRPCLYNIRLETEVDLAPMLLVKLGNAKIPGLTEPFKMKLVHEAPFEHMGADPATGEFFINE